MQWHFAHSAVIRAYLDSHHIKKLQLGAGSNVLPGWLNTDLVPQPGRVIYLDATKPFSFNDRTFDYVFSEHEIEHLTYEQGLFMLQECRRALKPGGRIRIATPNLENLANLYAPQKTELQERYIRWAVDTFLPGVKTYNEAFVINNFFRNWGHHFIYDRLTLQHAMATAGFTSITPWASGESDDENFRGIESHSKVIGDDMNQFETMVLEGRA